MKAEEEEEALAQMKERGGTWAAYVNSDLSSANCGHLKFLKVGAGCTFETAPKRYPDTPTEINWRYLYGGMVDLETGNIIAPSKESG